MPTVVFVVILIAVAIGAWFYMRTRGGAVAERPVASAIPTPGAALNNVDFKVEGATAHVYFDTHIPVAGADDVLVGLMGREAMRVFESKADHLPLEAIKHVAAHGHQGDETVEVTRVDIKKPVEMDHMDVPSDDKVVMADEVEPDANDLLGDIHAMEFGRGAGYRGGSDDLPPLAQELTIPAKVVDAVAGGAGSIDGMSLEDFITGLLRTVGYEVNKAPDGTSTARKGGVATYLDFVEHAAGSHPELDENSVDAFIVKFMASGAARGMLFTPKFSPYAIYEKERRNEKVKYMTRERLQAFVDSIAME